MASAADSEGIRWAFNNLESRMCKRAPSPNKVDSTEEEERHNYGRRRPDLYPAGAGRRRRPSARPRGGLDRFGGRQRNNYWEEEEEDAEEDAGIEEQSSSSSSEEDASAESSDSESGQEPSAAGQSINLRRRLHRTCNTSLVAYFQRSPPPRKWTGERRERMVQAVATIWCT